MNPISTNPTDIDLEIALLELKRQEKRQDYLLAVIGTAALILALVLVGLKVLLAVLIVGLILSMFFPGLDFSQFRSDRREIDRQLLALRIERNWQTSGETTASTEAFDGTANTPADPDAPQGNDEADNGLSLNVTKDWPPALHLKKARPDSIQGEGAGFLLSTPYYKPYRYLYWPHPIRIPSPRKEPMTRMPRNIPLRQLITDNLDTLTKVCTWTIIITLLPHLPALLSGSGLPDQYKQTVAGLFLVFMASGVIHLVVKPKDSTDEGQSL